MLSAPMHDDRCCPIVGGDGAEPGPHPGEQRQHGHRGWRRALRIRFVNATRLG